MTNLCIFWRKKAFWVDYFLIWLKCLHENIMMCLLKCLVKCEGYYTLWAILKITYLVNANISYIVCIEIKRRDRLISTNEIYKKLKCGIFKLIWDIFENRPPAMSILLRWIEIDMSSLYLSFLSMNICIFLKEFEPSERSRIGSVSKHGTLFVLVSRRCTKMEENTTIYLT